MAMAVNAFIAGRTALVLSVVLKKTTRTKMNSLNPWHYIMIAFLIFNSGVTVGGFVFLIKNHIKHINEKLDRIETKVCKNDNRIDEHDKQLAILQERTKNN